MLIRPWANGGGLFLTLLCLAALPVLHDDEPKPAPSLTPEQQARLKEADRLGAEAQQLWQAGKQVEAVAAWEKKVAIEREALGKAHPRVVGSLLSLARLQENRDDFAAARKA